jgi:hypothetical protein
LLLPGCATVRPDERFVSVQRVVQERLAQRLAWDRGEPEGVEIPAAVDGLLSQPLTADNAVLALSHHGPLE